MLFVTGTSVVELTGMVVSDLIRAAAVPPALSVDIPARPLREVLLAFRSSIQGRIPEILGDDEEERIETLVVLLDGTSEDDLKTLLQAAAEALSRLEAKGRDRASPPRHLDRRRHRRRVSRPERLRSNGSEVPL
jgi:hypothetical protein